MKKQIAQRLRVLTRPQTGLTNKKQTSCSTLNEERYNTYIKQTAVSKKKVEFKNFKATDSAGLYCLRVYLQVQSWDGIKLDPLQWGFAERG